MHRLQFLPIPAESFDGPPVEVGVGFDADGLLGKGEASSSQGLAERFEALEGLDLPASEISTIS